ncbi:peptidylprolyl isomerase [Streptomyces sp. NRRL S-1824]|uniref:peptidylprolyl isomerase n=1 Tax=Streptomyces sp. NRRL S-1824 TaxID=1463889 RepID=UPI003B642821
MRTALISAVAAVVVIAAGTAGYTVIHQSTSASGRTPPRTATAPNAPGTGAGTSVSPSSDPGTSASTRKSSWVTEPAMTIDTTATYTATIKLDQGTIGLSLDAGNAPHTVNSFTFLAGQGFFDGTKCHRLTTQGIFVLQCGDPKGDGTGGPGYTIPDENLTALGKAGNDGTVTYPAGTVAMANTGQPHTGGSQFFLVYKDSKLPPRYTPFGTMDDASLKAVGNIGAAGVAGGAADGAPNIAVVIDGVAVAKS